MTILGIDPGTGRCGYGVVRIDRSQPKLVAYDCLQYPAKMPIPQRLVEIEREITWLIDKFKPQLVAVESLFFNTNVTTAMQVAEARGVVVLAAAKRHLPVQDCTPLQVKLNIVGYGRATKAQVAEMTKLQIGGQRLTKLDDAVDAVAVAITGYHLYGTKVAYDATSLPPTSR